MKTLAQSFDLARTQYNNANARSFSHKTHGNTRATYDAAAGVWSITLHDTVIFSYSFRSGSYVVNSGGWNTVTTRRRINQAAEAAAVRVFASSRRWCFIINGEDLGEWARFNSRNECEASANAARYIYDPRPVAMLAALAA